MFLDSSRMSALAQSKPIAADHPSRSLNARFGLMMPTTRFDSREMKRPSKAGPHWVLRPKGVLIARPQVSRSLIFCV